MCLTFCRQLFFLYDLLCYFFLCLFVCMISSSFRKIIVCIHGWFMESSYAVIPCSCIWNTWFFQWLQWLCRKPQWMSNPQSWRENFRASRMNMYYLFSPIQIHSFWLACLVCKPMHTIYMQGTPEDPGKTMTEGSSNPSLDPVEEVCSYLSGFYASYSYMTLIYLHLKVSVGSLCTPAFTLE